MPNASLPVWQLRTDIIRHLTTGNQLVLVAATGSGKTTQVPQMLLDAGLAGSNQIIVLQPRRVAARTVATRVAWERNSRVGDEVGYQIRFEDRTSLGTRICFITEGILLRWLQEDQQLSDIGCLIFDEFHERNLLSDVALALAKKLQREHRPDLKLVVMSATLEAEPVARYLASRGDGSATGSAPILVSEGRAFPVELKWADYGDSRPPSEQAAEAVEAIVRHGWEGDVLVFMPGMGEINSTIHALRSAKLGERVAFIPLHGDLPMEEQDRAFQRSDHRKIVVATNVAETSITIDGIRHVIDAGLARVARYDAERGIQTLLVEDISRASADQRAGRAGRTSAGTCWRLWTESGHLNRPAKNTPEIQRADLAEVVLLLHSLGVRRAVEFDWLDRPEPAAVERAERLLVILGALYPPAPAAPANTPAEAIGRTSDLTSIGRQMLRLPMHPRFARMLVEGSKRGCVSAAALCAALVSGRDLLMRLGRDDGHVKEARALFEGSGTSDFHTLMQAYHYAKNQNFNVDGCRRLGIHAQTARQVDDTFRQLLKVVERERMGARRSQAGDPESDDPPALAPESQPADSLPADSLERCLLAGFVDQLAQRRDSGTLECDLTEGRRGTLARETVVAESKLLVYANIRELSGRTGHITLLTHATAVKCEWLGEMFPQHIQATVEHLYDRTHKRVAAVQVRRFLDLVMSHEHQRDVDPVAAGACLADAATRGWIDLPNLDHGVRQFVARVECIRRAMPELEFPVFGGVAVKSALTRAFRGLTLAKEAQALPLLPAFQDEFGRDRLSWLDELAPMSAVWEDRRFKLTYAGLVKLGEDENDESMLVGPEAQVKLSETFLCKTHPSVAEGKVPVRWWLLLPDGKRLDSTTNWPHWRETVYPKHRATLRTKYPGFLWP